jgi:hypothetical protein
MSQHPFSSQIIEDTTILRKQGFNDKDRRFKSKEGLLVNYWFR